MGHCHSQPRALSDTSSSSANNSTKRPWHRQPVKSIIPLPPSSTRRSKPTAWAPPTTENIFTPIQLDNVLDQVPLTTNHPVPRKGIEDDERHTLHTNSFYANSFLGDQNRPIWTHPYVLWWGDRKGGWLDEGEIGSMGMCVGHTEAGDFKFGEGTPAKVYKMIPAPFFSALPPTQNTLLG